MRAIPALLLIALAVAPAASAWTFAPAAPTPTFAGPAETAIAAVQGSAACALGDINADGSADLLLHAVDSAGHARLSALAGPTFQEAIWSKAIAATALLQCAPDLGVDGIADPVLRIVGEATSQVPGGTAQMQVVLQTLNGATGAVGIARSITESATAAAADGVGQVQQIAQGNLLPAASGTLAQVTTQVTGVAALLPGGLPVPGLDVQASASAALTLLDATGQVVGTVKIDGPGVRALALAALPTGGLPQVAALSSRALSQVDQLAAQVPTLSLFNPDGTLAWAVDLAATTGVPSLLPRIGDLNLDGVPDLLVQTVSGTVSGVPAATLTALSGLDGQILFATQAAEGLVAALPLGEIAGATALLRAVQTQAGGAIQLDALNGAGSVIWSAQLPALSTPVNLAFDAFTGDVVGFTDLTGDAVADVSFAFAEAGGLTVSTLDGLTGKVVWATQVPGASHVMALAQGAAAQAASALATLPGQASDLVAVGATGALNVTVLRGTDGAVEWMASAALSGPAAVSIQSAGDLDSDGHGDLLLALSHPAGNASAGASVDASGAQVYALSSVTGATLAANVTAPGAGALLDLVAQAGPAFSRPATVASGETVQTSPAAGVALLVAVVAIAAARRRTA